MAPRARPRSPSSTPSGIWRATITRVDGQLVYVDVPRLAAGVEWGPCAMVAGLWTVGAVTGGVTAGEETTGPASAGEAHTHEHPHTHDTGVDLAAGDRVLVAFVEGRANDLVVVGRLP